MQNISVLSSVMRRKENSQLQPFVVPLLPSSFAFRAPFFPFAEHLLGLVWVGKGSAKAF